MAMLFISTKISTEMKKEEVEWSRQLFLTLRIGAAWGIPRSGLIFKKIDAKTLVLIDAMPFSIIETVTKVSEEFAAIKNEFPQTQEELFACQKSDYQVVKLRFEAAGIRVENRVNPLFDINGKNGNGKHPK